MRANISGVDNLRGIINILYRGHDITMQAPRSVFETVIGVQQDGNQPLEIAELFQIFHSPKQENFHFIYWTRTTSSWPTT